ncbi:iron complex transport system permease protein [Arcanobacterium pluranimalium]|uniref:FecCD family ABC transporter permease n=1 Tax=Arcanobacterium pluranimalium TaxID=108028 RepID=UPI001957B00B|nr:iron ABC transporter permease [Arcanobacterium pluranimalium]MBM7824310.1 iron complex transport system permease protein [Arcanobacterium pluranimalium]
MSSENANTIHRKSLLHSQKLRIALVLCAISTSVILVFALRVMLGDPLVRTGDLALLLQGEDVPHLHFIVFNHRLPAATVGVLAGISFGISGAIFQTLLRNPLASPDVIGVSFGASAATVLAMTIFAIQGLALFGISIAGALITTTLVLGISRGQGGRFILIGIGVAAALQATITFVLSRADVRIAQDALHWMVGSLNTSTWERAVILSSCLIFLLCLVALFASRLSILELGDDVATSLGVRAVKSRIVLIVLAVVINAVAVAVTGPISFIAFLSGPIARFLLSRAFRKRCPLGAFLWASSAIGALLVLCADLAAHTLIPVSVPAGIVTGFIGAPFLLVLLVKSPQLRNE